MARLDPTTHTSESMLPNVNGLDHTLGGVVSSKYSELQLYLKIAMKSMEKVQELTSQREATNLPKFNKEQCGYLAYKLKLTIESASSFFHAICIRKDIPEEAFASCVGNFKLFATKAKEIESFIQDCCKNAWIEAAIILTKVQERVSSISFNLELCRLSFFDYEFKAPLSKTWAKLVDEIEEINSIEAKIVQEKAFQDEETLLKKVDLDLKSLNGEEKELAYILLERLESTSIASSRNLLKRKLDKMKQQNQIGKGASATVFKVNWLEMEVAKKVFYGSNNKHFEQELSTELGVFHANVMSILHYTSSKHQCSIFMELMDRDLTSLIWHRLETLHLDVPFSNTVVVDIILQIAEGMVCLHSKDIVHRDLKPNNVLVKITNMEIGYVHAKLADFGMSKTKKSSCSTQTLNIGTTRYMALEVIKIHEQGSENHVLTSTNKRKYPPKSDVYSFGMVCYQILTGKVPFLDLTNSEAKEKIKSGECPSLPYHCPPILKSLIEDCWKFNPKDRPTFLEICKDLRCIKYLLMTSCSSLIILPNKSINFLSFTTLRICETSSLISLLNNLDNYSSLTTCEITKCSKLTSLPNELGKLISLTSLNLSGCSNLISLPNELGNLTSLVFFNLCECSSLIILPNELGNFTTLTSLNLRDCSRLTSLPNELGNLSSLTTLNMSKCRSLASLPNELGNLTSLTSLNLSGCWELTSLPNELGNLTSLTSLNLCDCSRLTSLPNELGNLTSLTSLDMSKCPYLTSLPNELGNLASLTSLNLSGCWKLTSLPNELGNLTSLAFLNLCDCSRLTSLPIELGNLITLTSLNISGCLKLTSLPNELGNLTSLTSLNLCDCSRLTSLPNELGKLTSLTSLNLSRCQKLTSLPNELGNLTTLTSLNISGCQKLTSLPNELDNLTTLTSLNFSR
ncbi:light-sensor Protein kinase isoform X1 [Physcomitrium patens]|uniref:Protein kinase domain-containing protein n=1 Tax=Physcomitrium patens TaxID=3218 RepID=A0A2K1KJT0_PHYPA|nr:light-sensor Protein kinase-like isoform X1 [Physcomitrium patens]XP_024376122.1 light-sensor Protein kinase-like isoform X1 [Physcomitrium patens]XP_024376123.1 light-sensor Protein kinase-like isoform X1 [Physcomitrium patens]XP_024376124.1 light-sensor Protein kinase-like isoform X1 [Physcomitrium patens]XP_024376125.1 light-sensor Protein kinase-like isoform X1 [Physcomitrium patens]XP_024376127.1 light-sensor Protein kinase-like isoform X1 [Physcomitrium patens]PNR54036.1 hypothetical|eukprot:XP_024376121.1 light-sensor Protein kinase-like isoform X1 [Physcomitrella patens]